MGSTCSSVKKSSKDSTKSNDRKESAESIPYGQTSSECASSGASAAVAAAAAKSALPCATSAESGSSAKPTPTVSSATTRTGPSTTSHTQLGCTLSSSSSQGASVCVAGTSLSPVPPSTSPSPYSSGPNGVGSNPATATQSISPTKGHLSLSQYSESVRAASFTQLFPTRSGLTTAATPITTTTTSNSTSPAGGDGPEVESGATDVNDFYVIAVSTESDEVVVWSVYEEKAVRTVRGIARPRELRMVDSHRAVVLCNRELMLYDLNRARLVTKLKGVMNHKMPYYGLHSDHELVALSRNRMYVNLINLDTGDLETTFKAGEDRFLNSLLTSANGKICVCGDETQKPFPLLVWDLCNRKLLYDLRIPHHEFLTHLSAISDDGHYVVCVCQECSNGSSTNFLIVYDLQSGTLFKKWKPECNSVSVAISTRCGGCVINGIENNDVLVWDLSTGNIKYTLGGHTAPPDLLQPAEKANVFLSYNSNRKDCHLRIWSLEQGVCLWTFTPEKELSCCCLTPNGMAIVHGFVGDKSLHLAVRQSKSDQSAADHEQSTQVYLTDMCAKLVPYGDQDMLGCVIDLKSS